MGKIENLILENDRRGITILKDKLPKNYCRIAAKSLLDTKKGYVYILTGFYILDAKATETDGVIGTHFLAKFLSRLGYKPVVVCDSFSMRYFEEADDYETVSFDASKNPENIAAYKQLLEDKPPVALISIENCGRSIDGKYYNMSKKDVSEFTINSDELYLLSDALRISIGDGGNEIGFADFTDIIINELDVMGSVIPCDNLIIAAVSNWGTYGFLAYLELLTGKKALPEFSDVKDYFSYVVGLGAVDGVLGESALSADSFDTSYDKALLKNLKKIVRDK